MDERVIRELLSGQDFEEVCQAYHLYKYHLLAIKMKILFMIFL